MSGIVGGAGSKSGVIGTTELDYEEGTWTPALGASSLTWTSPVFDAKYIKIGKVVTITCRNTSGSLGATGTGGWMSGLPFTPSGPASSVMVDSSPDHHVALMIDNGYPYLYLDAAYAVDNIRFSFIYHIA